jgi:serine phosphatase RsbU (regulator of sigma subunit)
MLLLYTDGVLEAQNQEGEFLGEEGMLDIVQSQIGYSAQMVQDTLLAGVKAFAGPEPQLDDITLMVLIRDQALGSRTL